MKGPETYAEWLELLDRFRNGDDTPLETMSRGTIAWANVVAERWTRQLACALTARLDLLSKQLQKALDRASGNELAIENAMLAARRGLEPLRELAGLPAANQNVRRYLAGELDRWASDAQASLQGCVARARHDQGRLLKTLRDCSLAPLPSSSNAGSSSEAE